MRRIALIAGVGLVLVVGLLGYSVLWLASTGGGNGGGTVDATVAEFEPRVSVNALSLEQALSGNGTTSCVSTVPMPESWQLAGSTILERSGNASGERTLSWMLAVDGRRLSNGTATLDRYGSERLTFIDTGEWDGTLEPGSTATANLTVSHDGERITSEIRAITIHNRSEPPCPSE
ncbi:hypothetical protein [Halapricum hydrolyticum]|uniref:Uncharacterized protein n=1 Tax=Halapricum hydrolyticum TaxID=2979991 RepID=A0AAE3IAB3_9EURY|nr:hypothetical protein [Halapricum hydrolyticum]MCU4717655.1 hypothetical protein [Halapricum hydrolyticum]MCU4726816.1 hypothetical protein [Halapricum hydrolyticum]